MPSKDGDVPVPPINSNLLKWASYWNLNYIAGAMQSYQDIAARMDVRYVPQTITYQGRPQYITDGGLGNTQARSILQTADIVGEWIRAARDLTGKLPTTMTMEFEDVVAEGKDKGKKITWTETKKQGEKVGETVKYHWGFAPLNQPSTIPEFKKEFPKPQDPEKNASSAWKHVDGVKKTIDDSTYAKTKQTFNDAMKNAKPSPDLPELSKNYPKGIAEGLYEGFILLRFVTGGFIVHGFGNLVDKSTSLFTSSLMSEIRDLLLKSYRETSNNAMVLTSCPSKVPSSGSKDISTSAQVMASLCGQLKGDKRFQGVAAGFNDSKLSSASANIDTDASAMFTVDKELIPYMKVFREMIIGTARVMQEKRTHQVITIILQGQSQGSDYITWTEVGTKPDDPTSYAEKYDVPHEDILWDIVEFFRFLCDELTFGGLSESLTFTYIVVHGGICAVAREPHPMERQIFLPRVDDISKPTEGLGSVQCLVAASSQASHPMFIVPSLPGGFREIPELETSVESTDVSRSGSIKGSIRSTDSSGKGSRSGSFTSLDVDMSDVIPDDAPATISKGKKAVYKSGGGEPEPAPAPGQGLKRPGTDTSLEKAKPATKQQERVSTPQLAVPVEKAPARRSPRTQEKANEEQLPSTNRPKDDSGSRNKKGNGDGSSGAKGTGTSTGRARK